jgi:hypothetical protein
MTRWLILILIVVGISALSAWLVIPSPTLDSELPGGVLPGDRPIAKGPRPHLIVDGALIHEFGQMAQQRKGKHVWQIRNEGPGDLDIIGGEPSCSCTVLNLKKGQKVTVKPGDSYDMEVEWETRMNNGGYEKSASVFTNDPAKSELTFRVKGTVRPVVLTVPEDGILDVRSVSNSEPHEFNAILASPDRPDLKITSITSTNPNLIEVTPRPLREDEAKAVNVEKGIHLLFTLKPTERLGPFDEKVVLRTDHPDRGEVEFRVAGKIVGPVSVIPAAVRLNDVTTRSGGSTSLTIWVQGRDRTTFEVAKKPDKLKVTFGADDDKDKAKDAAGPGRAYRMTVTVDPGTPPGIINDPIVLRTDHPRAREIDIPVQILVMSEE